MRLLRRLKKPSRNDDELENHHIKAKQERSSLRSTGSSLFTKTKNK